MTKEEFKKLYPHESYSSEDNSSNWEKGKLVLEEKFDSKKSKTLDLKNIKKKFGSIKISTIFGTTITTKYKDYEIHKRN